MAEEVAREHDKLLRDDQAALRHHRHQHAAEVVSGDGAEQLLPDARRHLADQGRHRVHLRVPERLPAVRHDGRPLLRLVHRSSRRSPSSTRLVLRQFAALQNPDGFIPHDLGGSIGHCRTTTSSRRSADHVGAAQQEPARLRRLLGQPADQVLPGGRAELPVDRRQGVSEGDVAARQARHRLDQMRRTRTTTACPRPTTATTAGR